MKKNPIPQKLYKYKAFNVNSLRLITEAEVFYADPKDFNDPLDCKPDIKVDIGRDELEKLWKKMQEEKKTPKNIRQSVVAETLASYRYAATEHGKYNDGAEGSRIYCDMLSYDIRSMFLSYFGSMGVLSLAARWNCPLMWSHYSDEHKGICIEYDTDRHQCGVLKAVKYNASRFVEASTILDWKINNSASAQKIIFDQYFFAKATSWKYEREWRAIMNQSCAAYNPFKISGIYFGLRCDQSVQTAIVKLLRQDDGIKFYSIYAKNDGFKLARRMFDDEDLQECEVRESPLFLFQDESIN